MLDKVAKANVTTGYVVQAVKDELFETYIEANVHAPKIFDVFRRLVFALMPEVVAPLVGVKEEEPVFGPYTDRTSAVEIFEPYVDLLQNDGFLEFGMIHQSESAFEEVFVASSKYFKIWTNNGSAAEDILLSAGIPRCEALEFIDEYPMTSISADDDGNAAWVGPVYELQDEFLNLPQPSIVDRDQ